MCRLHRSGIARFGLRIARESAHSPPYLLYPAAQRRGTGMRATWAGFKGGRSTLPAEGVERPPILGLRANLGQFLVLVLVNAFVGAMVGLERSVLPLLGERTFGLTSATAALSFIISFGLTK